MRWKKLESQWVTKVPGAANGCWRFADLQIHSFYKLNVFLGPNRQSNIMTHQKLSLLMFSYISVWEDMKVFFRDQMRSIM